MDTKKVLYDNAKKNLTLKLVNKKTNAELLEGMPYKEFLDLAVIVLSSSDDGVHTYTLNISYGLLQIWEKTFEEVYQQAWFNLASEESMIYSSKDMLFGLTGDLGFDIPLYVLTNERYINGAVHMLKEEVLQKFSDKHNTDIFVIPSSVHEVLLLPIGYEGVKEEGLTDIIRSVNITEVEPKDILSDHVYVYKRSIGWDWKG